MDSIAALRVPVPEASTGESRPTEASVANKGIKVMELAAESAVAPAQRSESKPLGTPRHGPAVAALEDSASGAAVSQPRTSRNIEFDPITHDVIFQSISTTTGEVVTQVPTEQQLKIRHYARNGGEQPPPRPTRIA